MVKLSLAVQCIVFLGASQISHPFILSLWLIVSSIMAAFTLVNCMTFWVGVALVLVFLGGMMVVFLYFASLSNNDKTPKPSPGVTYFLSVPLMIGLLEPYSSLVPLSNLCANFSMMNLSVNVALVLYLLLTLLVVVELTQSFKGMLECSWF